MDGYLAEIRLFAGNFAPKDWAFCDGALLVKSTNLDLFNIIGTTYGGDGVNNFRLPDLRGRVAVGPGQGAGLSNYALGQAGGSEDIPAIQNSNFPAHTHPVVGTVSMKATAAAGNADAPQSNYPATLASTNLYSTSHDGNTMGNMQTALTSGNTGGVPPALTSYNMQPVLALNFIICVKSEVICGF